MLLHAPLSPDNQRMGAEDEPERMLRVPTEDAK